MITREQMYDLIHKLKPHTFSAFREQQRYRLPYIMDDERNIYDTDGVLHLQKCKIHTVQNYHYKDKWWYYKYSVDFPEETFGILRVENLPYKTFDDRLEKKSFISNLERMVVQDYLNPILLFIDNKYINWNDIDIVFDAGNTYFILHGDKYNWHKLVTDVTKYTIVVLPYKIEYLGYESDYSFNNNLSILTNYLQDELYIDKNDKVHTKIPTMDLEVEYREIVYNVGFWLYKQIRLFYLGLLAEDKANRLKSIMLYKYTKDKSGNVLDSYSMRFNALDRDVYDQKLYDKLVYNFNKDYNLLFQFNNDGYLDFNDGQNKFYLLSEHIYFDRYESSDKVIYNDHNNIKNILQRENYLVFKNNCLDIDCEIFTGLNNLMRISNPDSNLYTVFTFYNTEVARVYQSTAFKFNQEYLNAKAKEYFDIDRRINAGIMALLMDEYQNLTGKRIERLDTLSDRQIRYINSGNINYLDEDYTLSGIILDENNDDTDDEIAEFDMVDAFDPSLEGNKTIKVRLIAQPITNILDITYKEFVIRNSEGDSIRAYVDGDNHLFFTYNDIITSTDNVIDGEFKPISEITTKAEFINLDNSIIENLISIDGVPIDRKEYDNYLLIDIDCNMPYNPIMINKMYSLLMDENGEFTGETIDRELLQSFIEVPSDVDVNYDIELLNMLFAISINGKIIDEDLFKNYIILPVDTDTRYGVELISKAIAIKMENGEITGKTINNIIVDQFLDKNYMMPLEGIILLDYGDAEIHDYVMGCKNYLDFSLSDKLLYEENMQNAIDAVIGYDATIFNRLIHTNIESVVESGETANEHMSKLFMQESRYGLKIPRMNYNNHETYPIVFVNGELIKEYSLMIAYANFFFIPIEDGFTFNDTDEIEIMYFMNCNNNEIHFKLSDYVLNNKIVNEDNVINVDIFDKWISEDELKIFESYPENLLVYPTIVKKSNDIAFNVSYRDSSLFLYPKALENLDDRFTAVSSRKFIYQRLYVKYKSYRIKLDGRFKYCDNQKQYILFINGRRMNDDAFFITVPKYSRPFWGIYLYTRKFVYSDDRIEIFYVPQEMNNTNSDNSIVLKKDGYIENNINNLEVPYDNRLYSFFINGKKIPPTNLTMVSSSLLRLNKDTRTLMPLVINNIYSDTISEVVDYLHGDNLSVYDKIVDKIIHSKYLGKQEMDNLLDIYVKMSNLEPNEISQNVGSIAILNEIIRDFWVTSGYEYHNESFIYDYDIDEIFYKDKNNNIVLPSLDANHNINIIKDDIHMLFFDTDPKITLWENGDVLSGLKFIWEFSKIIFNEIAVDILWQKINDYKFSGDLREYTYPEDIYDTTKFIFTANAGNKLLQDTYTVKFVDPVYYGIVNESRLRYYKRSSIISINDIIALVPKNGDLPSERELLKHMEVPYILEDLRRDYFIFRNLTYINNAELILPSVFLSDIIALIPDDYRDLLNEDLLDIISETGLYAAKERWKWLDFSDYLLVDTFIDTPIEFINKLKAIIPADEREVTGFYDWPVEYKKVNDFMIGLIDTKYGYPREIIKEDKNYREFTNILLFDAFDETKQLGTYDELVYWLYSHESDGFILVNGVKRSDTKDMILYDINEQEQISRKFKELLVDPLRTDADGLPIRNEDTGINSIYIYIDPVLYESGIDKYAELVVDNETNQLMYIPYTIDENGNFIYDEYMYPMEDAVLVDEENTEGWPIDGKYTEEIINPDDSDNVYGPFNITDLYPDYHTFNLENGFLAISDDGNSISFTTESVENDTDISIFDLSGYSAEVLYAITDRKYDIKVYDDPDIMYMMPFDKDNNLITNSEDNIIFIETDENDNVINTTHSNEIYYTDQDGDILLWDDEHKWNIYAKLIDNDAIINDVDYIGYHGKEQIKEKLDRIIELGDNYSLLDLDINDAVKTGTFVAILADVLNLNSGFMEREHDSLDSYNNTNQYKLLDPEFYWNRYDQNGNVYLINRSGIGAINSTDLNEDESTTFNNLDDLYNIIYSNYVIDDIDKETKDWLNSLSSIVASDTNVLLNTNNELFTDFFAILMDSDGNLTDRLIKGIGTTDNVSHVSGEIINNIVFIDDKDLFALTEDERRIYAEFNLSNIITDEFDVKNEKELDMVISSMDKYLLEDPVKVDANIAIDNYNYFVIAIPKKNAYYSNGDRTFEFRLPDLNDSTLLNNTYEQYSTPLYTNGELNINNQLVSLDKMNMYYLGDINHTSEFNITQKYSLWRTNGYFTKIYPDYKLDIRLSKKAS